MAVGEKEILYIDSYHEGLPWSDSILRGIKSGLSTEAVDLRIEHMDTKRIDDKQYLQMLVAIYAHKFKDCRFAAIICSDDAAFQFLLQHHKLLFPEVPIVFCGVNGFEDNMLVGHPELTGVLETADLRTTLEIGLRFHPQAKHVLVINDRSLTGKAHRKAFEEIMPEFATKVTFRFVEDWELAELQDMLGKLPPNTIVFQMSLFRDRHGEFISITDGLELISKSSAAPIYSSWDYLVGHGIVGGMCVSAFRQGQAAIEIALQILRGADPANIPVLKESPNQYMFDHTQLVRFGIDANPLPRGSVVINKPVTWYMVDKRLLWTGSGLVVFLVSSLVVLGVHIRYKQLAEEDLRHEVQERAKAEEEYRSIFENAIEGIFQSTAQGRLVGANPAFAQVFGYDSPSQLMETVTNVSTFYVYPERRTELVRDLRKNKSVSGFEIEFYKRDGSKILATVNARAVLDVDGDLRLIEGMCQDITDRKRAEEALRASEQRYRSIFEESPVSLWEEDFSKVKEYLDDLRTTGVTDLRDHFQDHPDAVNHCAGLVKVLDVNKATLALLEANDKDELLAGLPRVFTRESLKVFQEELITLGEGGQEFRCEAAQMTLTGREKLVSLSVNVAPGYEASLGKVLVSLLDITERKRAEERLRESEERFRAVFENASIGIDVVDSNGRFLQVNRSLAEMLGYTEHELVNLTIFDVSHPDDVDVSRIKHEKMVNGESESYRFEERYVRKGGAILWADVSISSVRGPDGGHVASIGAIADITDRKQAERELQRSNALLQAIIEAAPTAIVGLDLDGNVQLVWNPAAEKMFGWSAQEVMGRLRPSVPVESQEEFTRFRERTGSGKTLDGVEVRRLKRDGTPIDCSIYTSPLHDAEGRITGSICVLVDITERKQAEQEKEKLQAQLFQAQKVEAIGQLAGGVAHDFNNLLTAMMGYSHMLLSELPQDGVHHARLSQILLAAEKACELTRQLLAFGRKQILHVKVLDLNEVIENIAKILQRVIGEHIELTTSLDPNLACVEADPTQVEQVLMNLAVNARDAMPNGGGLTMETGNVYLDESYAQTHPEVLPGPYVMFAVTDTGIGMDAHTRSRIFDPFFTTKEKGAGTGLGLSTVYGIVKQHRGHIAVYSEPGRGTTFKVYLSRIDKPVDRSEKAEITWPDHRGRETVLLVEDEEVVRLMATEVLEMLGYRVLEAGDPVKALELAEQFGGPIHLLLTDVVLPHMDGRSLYAELSSIRPNMKVLYASGYTENFIVHHGVLEEGVNFLSKPFTLDKLAAKVREVLDSLEG